MPLGMVLDLSRSAHLESSDEDSEHYDVISAKSDDGSFNKSLELCDDSVQPSFGNIAVTNSADVHFGNKTYYQGPVTIKQILYTNPKIEQIDTSATLTVADVSKDGKENPAFENECQNGDLIQNGNSLNLPNESVISSKWSLILNHKRLSVVIILVAILLVSFLILLSIFLAKYNSRGPHTYPVDTNEQDTGTPTGLYDSSVKLTLSGKLKIISRLEWVAQPPVDKPTPLKHPVPYVIIMHTATENCTDQATCTFHVRYIQSFHIDSKGWWDIGYNFLVGGDGFAYEGRAWDGEGAHTYGYNARSIGIAFIGTFNNIMPPQRQIIAAQQLIERGVEKGYIAKDYKLLAARQLQTTQSPGKLLYENMKTWPHWSETP